MQMIDFKALDRLTDRLNAVLDKAPEKRRELHERLSREILMEVRFEIGGKGKVQGWQEAHVGSKGGYAAVRPQEGFFAYKNGESFAIGHITNAIENGHKSRKSDNGRVWSESGRVSGKQFYHRASTTMEIAAMKEATRFVEELAKSIEGG